MKPRAWREASSAYCYFSRESEARQVRKRHLDVRSERFQKTTFGSLLGEIKGKAGNKGKLDLQPADAQRLEEALNLRNALTHGFFLERAEEIMSEAGRKKMVCELVSGAKAFRSAHLIVKACNGALADLAGMAPKLEAKMAKWLQRDGAKVEVAGTWLFSEEVTAQSSSPGRSAGLGPPRRRRRRRTTRWPDVRRVALAPERGATMPPGRLFAIFTNRNRRMQRGGGFDVMIVNS